MAEISIPGVSNKYGTNETIEKLMEVERVPLTREQNKLEVYKEEQSAWRDVNKQMTTLRENVRTLYSFDNPFNIKIASSTQEDAITGFLYSQSGHLFWQIFNLYLFFYYPKLLDKCGTLWEK